MKDKRRARLIDDEDAIQRSLDFMLRAAGHRVQVWPNGEFFLEGIVHEVSTCVLLRYCLSRINGLEARTRMSTVGVDLPIILVSEHGNIGVGMRAMTAVGPNCIGKTCDREKLLQSVEIAFSSVFNQEPLSPRTQWKHDSFESLTTRELDVLKNIACDFKNVEADDFEPISQSIEVYRANIITKLSVFNFADALRNAFTISTAHI